MYLFLTKIHQDGGPAVSPFGRMTNPRDVPSLLFKLGITKNGKGGPADLRSLTVGVNPRLSRWSQSYHRSPETPGPLLRSLGGTAAQGSSSSCWFWRRGKSLWPKLQMAVRSQQGQQILLEHPEGHPLQLPWFLSSFLSFSVLGMELVSLCTLGKCYTIELDLTLFSNTL